jgi:hypothetical protein
VRSHRFWPFARLLSWTRLFRAVAFAGPLLISSPWARAGVETVTVRLEEARCFS